MTQKCGHWQEKSYFLFLGIPVFTPMGQKQSLDFFFKQKTAYEMLDSIMPTGLQNVQKSEPNLNFCRRST